MKDKKTRGVLVVLFFIAACGVFWGRSEGKKDFKEEAAATGDMSADVRDENDVEREQAAAADSFYGAASEASASEPGRIVVHVCGAVAREGVYELTEGARVADAIRMAGGVTEEAAGEYLNQAAQLSDGIQVYVPSREETEKLAEDGASPSLWQKEDFQSRQLTESGKIDLNRADKEELMSLPGIGASKAEAILAFRSSEGAFSCVEDLMKIPGIKEGVFNKIEHLIVVNGK